MCVLAFAARRDARLEPLCRNNATAGDERVSGGGGVGVGGLRTLLRVGCPLEGDV